MRVSLEDLGALNWSLCPLSEDLSPLADPKELAVIRRPLSTWGDEVAAWGVVTGPISKVWAARKPDSASARVVNPLGLWGLIPGGPKPPKVHSAGTVVPVVGPGVTWVSGSPGALAGDDFAATVAAAVAGDRDSLIGLVRSAAKASGVEVLPTLDRADGWQEVSWPEPPAPIPWEEVLPESIDYVVRAINGYCGAPRSLVGLVATGFCGSALVGRVQVEMHTRDGLLWAEKNPGLYAIAVAGSSRMKSPIFDPLLEPWIKKASEIYLSDAAKHVEWKARNEAARAILSGRNTPPDEREDAAKEAAEPEPIERKLFVADITPARFVERCSMQPSLHLFSQEADTFFDRCVSDKNSDIAGLLHAYAGEAHGGVDRVMRKTRIAPGARLRGSMVGSLQPDILRAIGQNRKFFSQGLMARILYAIDSGVDEGGGKALPAGFAGHWAALLARLWSIPEVERNPLGIDANRLIGVQVSHKGTMMLKDFQNRMKNRSVLGGDLYSLQSWVGKAHGQAARLAGIWTLCEDTRARTIADARIADAIEIVENHLLRHAIAAWNLSYWEEGSDDARQIWERACADLGPVWGTEQLHNCMGQIKLSPSAFARIMQILEKRGFVRPVEGSKTTYLPNPIALDATLGAC